MYGKDNATWTGGDDLPSWRRASSRASAVSASVVTRSRAEDDVGLHGAQLEVAHELRDDSVCNRMGGTSPSATC
jgi:hypothetical protein